MAEQLVLARASPQPLFIDAEEHDRYVAAISHLPLMLSTALFTLVRSSPAWPELAALAVMGTVILAVASARFHKTSA